MNIRQDNVCLSSVLNSDYVFFIDKEVKKEEIVKFLAEKIHKQVERDITPKYLLEKVFEVEKLNNVLETGFYIPHAKLAEIEDFHCALALLERGFADPESNTRIKACFLLLTPNKPGFFQKHLNILSKLSQMFSPDFIEKLIFLKNSQKVLKTIKSAE